MAKAKRMRKSKKSMSRKTRRTMRWTIAGLFMATAIVIAFIPVQNGGVSAVAITAVDIPSFEQICTHEADRGSIEPPVYGVFTENDLSVSPKGKPYKGFPLWMIDEGEPSAYELETQDKNVILRINDLETDDAKYVYEYTDSTGRSIPLPGLGSTFFVMSKTLPKSESDKSIYRIAINDTSRTSDPDTIKKFTGVENSYFGPNDTVPLSTGSVGYCPDAEWNDEYRMMRVRKYDAVLDANGNPTGVFSSRASADNTYLVCSNSATIQYIADDAFSKSTVLDATNIKNIDLPDTILQIGNNAFRGQRYLKEVKGGRALTSIGKNAFDGCGLEDGVTFVENSPLTKIGDGAFANSNLQEIILSEYVEKIGSGVFYNCPNLDDCPGEAETEDNSKIFSITSKTANNQFSLGSYVFALDRGLKNIAFDNDINSIGEGLFAGCTNLNSVVFPRAFTGNYPESTFFGVNKLKYLRIPDDNIQSAYALSDQKHPATGKDLPIFVTELNRRQLDLDREYITQDNQNFALWGPDPKVTESNVHKYALKYGLTYMFKENGVIHYEITPGGYTFDFDSDGKITGCTATEFASESSLLEIPKEIGGVPITAIDEDAFKNMKPVNGNPTRVFIPDTIKKIGANAFENCANITTVEIETSGVDIGDSAFANNKLLKEVRFTQTTPTGDTTIGASCFEGSSALDLVAFRNADLAQTNVNVVNVTKIGENAFNTGNNAGIRIRGKMDPDYEPYKFATNPENRTSSGANAYVTYETGNPDNLVCRYSNEDNCVILKSYPCADTIIGPVTYIDEALNIVTKENGTIHDLEQKKLQYSEQPDKYPELMTTVMEEEVLRLYKNIVIPAGIDSIEKASAKDGGATHGVSAFRNLNEDDGQTILNSYGELVDCKDTHVVHALQTLDLQSIKAIPAHAMQGDKTLKNVILSNPVIEEIGDEAFKDCTDLEQVTIKGNVTYKNLNSKVFSNCAKLTDVKFDGEGSSMEQGTPDDPFYWCDDGIIYKYDGNKITLVECLPGVTDAIPDPRIDEILPHAFENCDKIQIVDFSNCNKLTEIPEYCFYDCDMLTKVILPEKCQTVKKGAFDVDPELHPDRTDQIYAHPLDVWMNAHEIYFKDNPFENRRSNAGIFNTLHSYDDTAAQRYAEDMPNVNFLGDVYEDIEFTFIYWKNNDIVIENVRVKYGETPISKAPVPDEDGRAGFKYTGWDQELTTVVSSKDTYPNTTVRAKYAEDGMFTITFLDWDGTTLLSETVPAGKVPDTPAKMPSRKGYTFLGWDPEVGPVTTNTIYKAKYEKEGGGGGESTSSSSSGGGGSTSGGGGSTSGGGGSTSGGGGGGSASNRSSSSGSSAGTSSGSSVRNSPVVVSGAPAPYVGMAGSLTAGTVSGPSSTTESTGVRKGNTNVISTADGVDDSKMSATVNGSSDNYIIKITETSEANEMAKQALTREFGELDSIRYFPFDVSLYDSTGTQKISPVPDGVSVSVTMPIPEDLKIYGGNNKVGSTIGGALERLQPKFTVIDSVPCMNFTVTHLSPYVIYVDTANLTASGVADATPKTADPIHPKWFLVIGFAAISIFLFLKRDKQTVPVKSA